LYSDDSDEEQSINQTGAGQGPNMRNAIVNKLGNWYAQAK
jgi:hypothetical protein